VAIASTRLPDRVGRVRSIDSNGRGWTDATNVFRPQSHFPARQPAQGCRWCASTRHATGRTCSAPQSVAIAVPAHLAMHAIAQKGRGLGSMTPMKGAASDLCQAAGPRAPGSASTIEPTTRSGQGGLRDFQPGSAMFFATFAIVARSPATQQSAKGACTPRGRHSRSSNAFPARLAPTAHSLAYLQPKAEMGHALGSLDGVPGMMHTTL